MHWRHEITVWPCAGTFSSRVVRCSLKGLMLITSFPERTSLARFSRGYLFAWRIGTDDADNGVFLPEQFGMSISGLEKANAHSPIHGKVYHTEVASRLLLRRREPASAGRAELKAMREDMLAGTFPYK